MYIYGILQDVHVYDTAYRHMHMHVNVYILSTTNICITINEWCTYISSTRKWT